MPYFLPKTAHNIRQYLSEVEDRHFPEFAARHDQIMSTSASHWEMLKDRVGGASQDVGAWSKNAVEGIERNTGLKVGEVVRRGQEAAGKVRSEIEGKVPGQGVALEKVGYVVEQKPVAEIVRPVPVATEAKSVSAPVAPAAPAAPVAQAAPAVAAPATPAAAAATPAPVKVEEKKSEKRLV